MRAMIEKYPQSINLNKKSFKSVGTVVHLGTQNAYDRGLADSYFYEPNFLPNTGLTWIGHCKMCWWV